MKILEITDDSGYLGLVNFNKYQSFVGADWDFESMENHIVKGVNSNNILFWSTGMENTWKVELTKQESQKKAFREVKGVIEITNKKLFLTNYEALTMGAQFKEIILPEPHHKDLYIDLDNGKYMIKIKQMHNPTNFNFDSQAIDFEIVVLKITKLPQIYVNKVDKVTSKN
jgi:hypothetical protein